ncbi:MAG: hypothetical protein WD250_17925 [Egibacteraceae bacterium]
MPLMKLKSTSTPAPAVAHSPQGRVDQPVVEIWGQCGKCRAWFGCDSWFDRTVPMPTCPTCAFPPGALRYERGDVPPGSRHRILSELWIG